MFVGGRRTRRASVRSTQTRPGRFTMRTSPSSEVVNQDRRQLLSAAAMGIAAAGAAGLFPAYPAPAATLATSDEIRPFRITVPEEALVDLRRRINATRWPDRETVVDESQGVPLAVIWEVARYWGTDYDWRKCEATLNALPQFMTETGESTERFMRRCRRRGRFRPMRRLCGACAANPCFCGFSAR